MDLNIWIQIISREQSIVIHKEILIDVTCSGIIYCNELVLSNPNLHIK